MTRVRKLRREGSNPEKSPDHDPPWVDFSLGPPIGLPKYRLLAGRIDTTFEKTVSEALDMGYRLHGPPVLTVNGTELVAAQAMLWPDFKYYEDPPF